MNFAQLHNEHDRLIHNMLLIGTVLSTRPAQGLARFKIGENETDWLTIPSMACGLLSIWRCPTVGEQFVLACPSGDMAQAVPLVALPSTYFPMPSQNPNEIKIKFPAGEITLNQQSGVADFKLNTINMDADVKINGDLKVSKNVQADGDVTAGNISLQQHTHSGVRTGGGVTGVPQ